MGAACATTTLLFPVTVAEESFRKSEVEASLVTVLPGPLNELPRSTGLGGLQDVPFKLFVRRGWSTLLVGAVTCCVCFASLFCLIVVASIE